MQTFNSTTATSFDTFSEVCSDSTAGDMQAPLFGKGKCSTVMEAAGCAGGAAFSKWTQATNIRNISQLLSSVYRIDNYKGTKCLLVKCSNLTRIYMVSLLLDDTPQFFQFPIRLNPHPE